MVSTGRSDHDGGSGLARAILGTLAIAALWVGVAAWRPTTTYHLAPAVLAWTPPYLSVVAGAGRWGGAFAAVAGGMAAAGVSLVLAVAGWLDGPALIGGGPLAESLLVSGGAAVVGVVGAVVIPYGRARG